jgi:1-aminocyclopropane-1-carboxylate deaminase/D-cysteine desulfhydrase-like pyridoxal-dependent ACC family enzyme
MRTILICCVLLLCRGYVEAVREIEQQIQSSDDVQFDDIVVACGRYFIDTHYSLLLPAAAIMSCLHPE